MNFIRKNSLPNHLKEMIRLFYDAMRKSIENLNPIRLRIIKKAFTHRSLKQVDKKR